MAIPSIDVSQWGDFRGALQSGGSLFQQMMQPVMQQRGMQQEWQQHLRNAAIREEQERRLIQQHHQIMDFRNKQEQRLAEQFQTNKEQAPLKLDLLKKKIENETKKQEQKKLSEEEKYQRRIQEYRTKKEIEKEMKGSEDYSKPTKSMITQAQKTVQSVNSINPVLNKIMKTEFTPGWQKRLNPDLAEFQATLQGLGADEVGTIFNLPKVKESFHTVLQMVTPGLLESETAYRNRVKQVQKFINERGSLADSLLKGAKIELHPQESSISANGDESDPFGIL